MLINFGWLVVNMMIFKQHHLTLHKVLLTHFGRHTQHKLRGSERVFQIFPTQYVEIREQTVEPTILFAATLQLQTKSKFILAELFIFYYCTLC